MSESAAKPRAPCIYIDADACPQAIRTIIIKTAERTGLRAIFVANHAIGVRSGGLIEQVQVGHGFDVADDWIVDQCQAFDVLITSDIPLASDAMKKGAMALNHRGEIYSADTIAQKLSMRDFMDTMRSSLTKEGQVMSGSQNSFGARDKQLFAASLDKLVVKAQRLAPKS
jgi:uncharacterized protein YaiI (UPF0178 family)